MSDTTQSTSIDAQTPPVPHAYDGWSERAVRGHAGAVEQFAGVIRQGPNSGDTTDFTDARYYVDRAVPNRVSNGPFSASADLLPGLKQTVAATNLAEAAAGTHFVPPGTSVQVFSMVPRVSGSENQYVFNLPPVLNAVVQISGTAADGEYDGVLLSGPVNASDSTALNMPMGMSPGAGAGALILNLDENALAGHRLKTSSYAQGIVQGMTGDSPPKSIVVIGGGVGRTDGATSLGSYDNASETPDSSTWSRVTDATPVNVFLATRVVYNPTGDKTLYAFIREFFFDARGMLIAIGGEARMTIDATESCP